MILGSNVDTEAGRQAGEASQNIAFKALKGAFPLTRIFSLPANFLS